MASPRSPLRRGPAGSPRIDDSRGCSLIVEQPLIVFAGQII